MFIKVKAFPGSNKEKLIKKSEDSFEIHIKEKAERGLANNAIVIYLSKYFKTPANKFKLIKGARGKSKIFSINL